MSLFFNIQMSRMKTQNNMILAASVIGLTLVEASAVYAITKWSKSSNNALLAVGIILYALVGASFAASLHYISNVNTVNALWQAFSLAIVSLLAALLFKEKISPVQWVGVVLAVLASLCFAF